MGSVVKETWRKKFPFILLTILFLGLVSSPAHGQELNRKTDPPPPPPPPAAPKERSARAVAVVEWLGDQSKPSEARLVPVSIFYEQQFQDAGVFLARPAPLAVATDTEYAVEHAGVPFANFVVQSGSRSHDPENQDVWHGIGTWHSLEEASAKPSDEEGRPHFKASKPAGVAAPSSTAPSSADKGSAPAGSGTSPSASAQPAPVVLADDSNDGPTLKRRSASDSASATGGTSAAPPQDPNRPRMQRGKPKGMSEPTLPDLVGDPPNLRREVAVSDAGIVQDHSLAHIWHDDQEKIGIQEKMMALAQKQLAAPASLPKPASATGASGQKVYARRPMPPAQRKKTQAAPVELENLQFSAFDLSFDDEPTFVLTAQTADTSLPVRYVTIVGRSDIYGQVQPLLAQVASAASLDLIPRLRLVDAVDADGDGRAELLFEEREASQRRFVLFRVFRGQASRLFQTAFQP